MDNYKLINHGTKTIYMVTLSKKQTVLTVFFDGGLRLSTKFFQPRDLITMSKGKTVDAISNYGYLMTPSHVRYAEGRDAKEDIIADVIAKERNTRRNVRYITKMHVKQVADV